ncbi:MAG: type II toxin-antitoxin system RelE/ParE family toxin, partial [Desulfobacteria bacterium]
MKIDRLQDELLAHAILLKDYGPNLGRPTVDTLFGSKYPNMKELRFNWEKEVWRVAFAFDPRRQAVLLV